MAGLIRRGKIVNNRLRLVDIDAVGQLPFLLGAGIRQGQHTVLRLTGQIHHLGVAVYRLLVVGAGDDRAVLLALQGGKGPGMVFQGERAALAAAG